MVAVTTSAKDNSKAIAKAIQDLASKRVLVGVPARGEKLLGSPPDGPNNRQQGSINNAALAYIHENGAPEVNIPARPFLRPGVESAKDKIIKSFERAGKAVFVGDIVEADKQLMRAGFEAQSAVRNKITDGPFLPLAPVTIAARLRRGHPGQQSRSIYGKGAIASSVHVDATGMQPLIDTGQLRASINFVIRKIKP